jgi:drug/metabolite transporter (DMT)-like permease
MEITGELLAVANAMLFAFSNVFNKRALEHMDKDSGMVVTLVVNNVINILIITALYLSGKWIPVRVEGIIWFVLAGALTSFVGRYLILESVNINGPSRAGAYKVASPVFTLLIGMFIMREQVNFGSMAGAVISLIGLWIISFRNPEHNSAGEESVNIKRRAGYTGVVIGLGSGLCFALGMASRKVGMTVWPSALAGAFTGSLTAFTLLMISFLLRQKTVSWPRIAEKKALNYVYSGLSTGLAVPCFFLSLHYITLTIAGVIASLEPLFTIGLAYWILREKERITGILIFGAVLVSIGAALIFIY